MFYYRAYPVSDTSAEPSRFSRQPSHIIEAETDEMVLEAADKLADSEVDLELWEWARFILAIKKKNVR